VKRKAIVIAVSLILVAAVATAVVGFDIPHRAFGNDPPRLEQSMPGPEIPQLTESEAARAKEIAVADARVQELIQGKGWVFGRIGVWHTTWEQGLKKIGAVLEIYFGEPCQIEYDWPVAVCDDENKYNYGWPPYREITIHEAFEVRSLTISVDLTSGEVVTIMPM
jgi:hypothetical protein